MRYPPQFLDRIRQHFRLSEVIGRRLQLRKAGREYHALCPFHGEKTPSFTINDEKAFYHCFGCGAHGDVINFVKEYEGLSWQQAVESLAREAGLELPKVTPQMREMMSRTEALHKTVELSAVWFSQKLQQIVGAEARDYLERRGITQESIATFRIGYAPEGRDGLKSSLLSANVPLRDIEETGLLTMPDNGVSYDKFRGRIIFPIRDIGGRVVGFGGRLMVEAERAPKYLNSPQTPLFDKGRLLYNADQARIAVGRGGSLLVAEGYMDVIALHQGGFPAAVAPLGTAVTEDHLRMLWQMADEPIFCLDGDNAGQRAMQRVAGLALPMLKPGKSLRFCVLPAGEDPDSLIKSRGAQAMDETLRSAVPLVEMLWRMEVLEKPSATPEQRAAAEQGVARAVERIQDASVRRAYQDEMRQRFWQWAKQSAGRDAKKTPKGGNVFDLAALKATTAEAANLAVHRDACLRQMLTLLAYFPALLEDVEIEAGFTAIAPHQEALEVLYQALVSCHMEGVSVREELLKTVGEAEQAAWQGNRRPFDLGRLLKQSEAEGLETARLYYAKLTLQLLEMQIGEDARTIGDMDSSDSAANERKLALQQQLERLKAMPLLQGDFSS